VYFITKNDLTQLLAKLFLGYSFVGARIFFY